MAIVDQETAVEELKDHFSDLESIVHNAWKDVNTLPTSSLIVMSARSRASLVHDHIIAHAASYADRVANAHPFVRKQMRGLVLNGRYAVRFKKFDDENKSKNQPTQQVAEFRSQIELDGIDAMHHLEIGYLTNELDTDVIDVRIACPSGEGNAWVVSISGNEASTIIADLFPSDSGDGGFQVEPADIEPREKPGVVVPIFKASE